MLPSRSLRIVLLFAVMNVANTARSEDQYQTRFFDLRDKEEGNCTPYVILCARAPNDGSKVGHIWASWLATDAAGKIIAGKEFDSFGFYPDASKKKEELLCAFNCAGRLFPEEEINPKTIEGFPSTHRLVLIVSQADFDKSLAVRKEWEKVEDYSLFDNSCKRFVSDIANVWLGKFEPASTDRPHSTLIKIADGFGEKFADKERGK